MKCFQNLLLVAVVLATGSTAFAQSEDGVEDNGRSSQSRPRESVASAVASDNSLAVSIAINGRAFAEAEDGSEALAIAREVLDQVAGESSVNDRERDAADRGAPTRPASPAVAAAGGSPLPVKSSGCKASRPPCGSPVASCNAEKPWPECELIVRLPDGRTVVVPLNKDEFCRLIAVNRTHKVWFAADPAAAQTVPSRSR